MSSQPIPMKLSLKLKTIGWKWDWFMIEYNMKQIH